MQRGGQVQAQQRRTEDAITAGAHRIPHGEPIFPSHLLVHRGDMALGTSAAYILFITCFKTLSAGKSPGDLFSSYTGRAIFLTAI